MHPDPTADNGPAADPDAGPETAAVGYDAGLKHLLVGSDGTHVPVGRNLRKAEKKLKRSSAPRPGGRDGASSGTEPHQRQTGPFGQRSDRNNASAWSSSGMKSRKLEGSGGHAPWPQDIKNISGTQ